MPGEAAESWARALSILTHELQAPTGAIQIYVNLARRSVGPRQIDELDVSLEGIEMSVLELNRVIHTLSRAREVDAGEIEVSKELADVGELVRRSVEDLSDRIAPGRIGVTVPERVTARVDAGSIYDVLEELLTNAARFSPEGEPIEVFVEQVDHRVEITVLDRGPGIPEEQSGEAFERFSTLGMGSAGMGLGLFIARGIARANGGDLTADRTSAGACRFRLSIPLD
jgi:two-component system, OmpR family, sensor histidine kinase KdpD